MKYINIDPSIQGAESSDDMQVASELLKRKLTDTKNQLAQLADTDTIKRAKLLLDCGYTYLDLGQNSEAWQVSQPAFQTFIDSENWEGAVQACKIMFNAEQPDSLVALGNGIWLAVTFPINPELSVAMLEHIIDETPNDSDGGAVAAAAALYIADVRADGESRDSLLFFTNQLLAKVARRHSNIEDQATFDVWLKKLGLDSPDEFLGRLAQILEVMVQGDWWVDREVIRAKLPTD
jgi:hypothetical protein